MNVEAKEEKPAVSSAKTYHSERKEGKGKAGRQEGKAAKGDKGSELTSESAPQKGAQKVPIGH